MNKLLNSVLLLIIISGNVDAKTMLRVGLIEGERPPYFFKINEVYQGIYIDLLNEISAKTSIDFEFVSYPQARLRTLMLTGRLDVEPGIDITWRMKPNEVKRSVYSKAFMRSNESWVMRKDKRALFRSELDIDQSIKRCGVLGFNLAEDIELNLDINANNDKHILYLIEKRRCDIALIPDHVLHAQGVYQNNLYSIIAASKSYQLRLRFTKEFTALLPRVDSVISNLTNDGTMQKIINKYTNASLPVNK